jgi:TetR/AcrR family transcriptional repressor of cmeABC operon
MAMNEEEGYECASNKTLSNKAEIRCHKILDVAYRLFLENGYENVSMNDIVKHAGGSLATLYKHIGSKEQLFITVLERKNEELFDVWNQLSAIHQGHLKEFLYAVGKFFLELVTTEDAVLFHRLIVGVGYMNDAKLSEFMMQTVMSYPSKIIASFLENERQKGHIEVDNTMLCAQQFLHALKEPFILPCILGVHYAVSEHDRLNALNQLVSIFVKGLKPQED